jgi:(p)ppGpp synthase/HD superfamily hydrolase
MAAKLHAYAQRRSVPPASILDAYESAISVRLPVLGDVFHPDLLHPARTILILLEDAECTDPQVLTAAALVESEYASMRLDEKTITDHFGAAVAGLVSSVPRPDQPNDELLEELVTSNYDVGLIAVAERLDHARHLRFRDQELWQPFFEQITSVYLPFSSRVNARLSTRLERWATGFARQVVTGSRATGS